MLSQSPSYGRKRRERRVSAEEVTQRDTKKGVKTAQLWMKFAQGLLKKQPFYVAGNIVNTVPDILYIIKERRKKDERNKEKERRKRIPEIMTILSSIWATSRIFESGADTVCKGHHHGRTRPTRRYEAKGRTTKP